MTDIGVRRGKLYLRGGRRWNFPGCRFPRGLKRKLGRRLFDDNHIRSAVSIVSQLLRLDARGRMKHRSRLIKRCGMDDRPRLESWVEVKLFSRIDGRPEPEKAAMRRAGGVGGAHRRDDVVNHFQVGNRDHQGDVGIDAHAQPKAKRGRAAPGIRKNRRKAGKTAVFPWKTNLISPAPMSGEEFRL